MILKTGVTWEECCSNSNVDVAWSNYTQPGNKISLLGFLGLVTCHPCKGSSCICASCSSPLPRAGSRPHPLQGKPRKHQRAASQIIPRRGSSAPDQSRAARPPAGRCRQGGETCEGVQCGPGKVCRMKHGRPHCTCAPDCSSLPKKLQVCGSDGYTYRDECELLTAKCRDHPDLEVMYQGKCKKSCSSVVCPGTHTCVVDQTGSAHCVMCRTAPCPDPSTLDQVLCGNNNITYLSACQLRRATCFLGRSIGVRHYGSCLAAARPLPDVGDAEENYV
ncbi:follistatin-related protein 3 isoform X2 [Pelodiscus sinensis]